LFIRSVCDLLHFVVFSRLFSSLIFVRSQVRAGVRRRALSRPECHHNSHQRACTSQLLLDAMMAAAAAAMMITCGAGHKSHKTLQQQRHVGATASLFASPRVSFEID
jgi:hypothetical protein